MKYHIIKVPLKKVKKEVNSKMDIIKSIEHEQLKNKIPELKVGNTVKVHVRIKEGNKERIKFLKELLLKYKVEDLTKHSQLEKHLMV